MENFAKVERKLCLKRYFGKTKWAWKRVWFRNFKIPNSINRHMLIVGESGSGKSNAAKCIIKHLSDKGANFVLFDPHDEYVSLAGATNASLYDASYVGSNIFELGSMSLKEKSSELTELFRRIFKLGEVQSNVLYKLISYTYSLYAEKGKIPNISSIIYSAKVFKKHASKAELRALNTIESRFSLANEVPTRSIDSNKLMHSKSIFALSSLHTSEAQSIYIEGFLRKIYTNMLESEKKSYNFYIVIDEIEKLGQSSILAKIANEGRKYGIGIIAIAQHAKSVEKSVRGNASLVLAFYQREPEELNYIANMISGGNELERFSEIKKAIRNLKKGEAISLSIGEPQIIKFKLFSGREEPSYYIYQLARNAIKEESLFEKLREKGFSNDEIYYSIQNLKNESLISDYLLESTLYKGRYYMKSSKNGAEHEIMVNIISNHLSRNKVGNKIYNTSYAPDIIARIKGQRIAIEYETGKKTIQESKEMLEKRSARFNKVIVIVNDLASSRYENIGIENVKVVKASAFLESNPLSFAS